MPAQIVWPDTRLSNSRTGLSTTKRVKGQASLQGGGSRANLASERKRHGPVNPRKTAIPQLTTEAVQAAVAYRYAMSSYSFLSHNHKHTLCFESSIRQL